MKTNNPANLITKLTALWAVSESGLGGIFHALKLPFSGLFLGSFAVIIVTFIAINSDKKFKSIAQATLLVLLVKAMASPHSPFTAYVAVLFQGILGAIIYSVFKVNFVSAIFYGVLALLESGFQKLLMMVLIFGENIWTAFREFFNNIATQFNISMIEEIPIILVIGYLLIYFIGGIFAGVFAIRFPKLLETEFQKINWDDISKVDDFSFSKKKKNQYQFIGLLFILIFIVGVFIFSGSFNQAMYAILRTLAALAILMFLVRPLFQYLLNRWKNKQKSKFQKPLEEIMELVPQFRNHAKTAFKIAEKENNIFKKFRTFLLTWMSISLYHERQI